MRLPSVLDLLAAIRRVSIHHPAARSWWLTPRARLPVKGETSLAERSVRVIDLAIEGGAEVAVACPRIERELSDLLPGTMITVRVLRSHERQGMMRLLSLDGLAPEASEKKEGSISPHSTDTARAQA